MAENKKGFILYADLIHTVNKMTDEQAGALFRHILSYVNDKNPQTDDLLTQIAFEPIKQQMKRDLVKWSDTKLEKSKAGILGNLKRYYSDIYDQVKSGKITLDEGKKLAAIRKASHSDTNVAVNDNVSVNVNVKDKVKVKESKGKKENPSLPIETFESLFIQHLVNNKIRINALTRDSIIALGLVMKIKLPTDSEKIRKDKLVEMINKLAGKKFWNEKRHNMTYLEKNFEEAWNIAYPYIQPREDSKKDRDAKYRRA